jgi:hypothetical protein
MRRSRKGRFREAFVKEERVRRPRAVYLPSVLFEADFSDRLFTGLAQLARAGAPVERDRLPPPGRRQEE